MIKKMEELLITDIEQTIQKYWVKIDNSTLGWTLAIPGEFFFSKKFTGRPLKL